MNSSDNSSFPHEALPSLRDFAAGRALELAAKVSAVAINGFVILVISLAKSEPLASPSFTSVAYLLGVFAAGAIAPILGLQTYLGTVRGIFATWLPQLHINALVALIRVLAVWVPLKFAAYVACRPWRKHLALFVAALALLFATLGGIAYDGRFSSKLNPRLTPYVLVASVPALAFVPTSVVLTLAKVCGKNAPIGHSQKALARNLCLITFVDWTAHVLLFISRISVRGLLHVVGPNWFRAIIFVTGTLQDFATVMVYLGMSAPLRAACWWLVKKGLFNRKVGVSGSSHYAAGGSLPAAPHKTGIAWIEV